MGVETTAQKIDKNNITVQIALMTKPVFELIKLLNTFGSSDHD